MTEFEIKVSHRNVERSFTATFFQLGYSYRIEVEVEGTVVRFEPDEERNWRAIIADPESGATVNSEVLQEIIKFLDASL